MIRASGWLGKRSQICFQLKESSTSLSQKHTLCFWRVQRYLKREVNPFLACWPFSGIGKKPRLWSIRSIHPEDHHCSKEFEHFYTDLHWSGFGPYWDCMWPKCNMFGWKFEMSELQQRSISGAGDRSSDGSLQFSTPASLYILPSISISGNV